MSKVIKKPAPQPPRDYRKELWVGVCIAVARAESAKGAAVPGQWANTALKQFDEAFKEQ